MGEIWLVRHGQASYGAADYDRLSDLGRRQARWLGAHWGALGLSFDAAVTGEMRRHRETLEEMRAGAAELRAVLPEPAVAPGFNEFGFNELLALWVAQGGAAPAPDDPEAGVAALTAAVRAWRDGTLAGVEESWPEFDARIRRALGEVGAQGRRVLVVTSAGPVSAVAAQVLGLDSEIQIALLRTLRNTSVTRVAQRGGGWALDLFNATPHLETPDRLALASYV